MTSENNDGQVAEIESTTAIEANKTSEDGFAWSEGMIPTDNQLRVARNLGAEDSVVDRMIADGMSRSAYYNIAAAEYAERYLGAKYDIAFEASDTSVEDPPAGEPDVNRIIVKLAATEGDFANTPVTAHVSWRSGEAASCTENYFTLARGKEYSRYVEELLADALDACEGDMFLIAGLSAFLSVGDDFGADTPIDQIVRECPGNLSIVMGPSEDVAENSYRADLALVLEAAVDVNPDLFFDAGYLTGLEEYDSKLDASIAESYLHATRTERRALCVWRLSGTVLGGVEGARDLG